MKKVTAKKEGYSLECPYYTKSFPTLQELIEDITITGMDPSYHVLKNGKRIGEKAQDFINH